MRIYLDNCCFNRPYDNQSQIRIHLETEAKLHIQELILAECKYFITTDDRLLKYKNDKVTLIAPCEFIRILEGENG